MPASSIFRLDNGDVLEVTSDSAAVVDHVTAGVTYVDGTRRRRRRRRGAARPRHLADDGVVVIVATVEGDTGEPIATPRCHPGFSAAEDPQVMEETRLEVERSLRTSAGSV